MKLFRFFIAAVLLLAASAASAQLPSVKLKSLDGKIVDTSKLSNGGKPFVISFFATWCKPCNRELKAIHEVYPDWQKETGMKLVAIIHAAIMPAICRFAFSILLGSFHMIYTLIIFTFRV